MVCWHWSGSPQFDINEGSTMHYIWSDVTVAHLLVFCAKVFLASCPLFYSPFSLSFLYAINVQYLVKILNKKLEMFIRKIYFILLCGVTILFDTFLLMYSVKWLISGFSLPNSRLQNKFKLSLKSTGAKTCSGNSILYILIFFFSSKYSIFPVCVLPLFRYVKPILNNYTWTPHEYERGSTCSRSTQ